MNDNPYRFEDHEIIDVDDFSAYGPIIGCAVVPVCGVALLLSWLLNSFNAPGWTNAGLAVLYVTSPYAALLWWTRNKKAIRLATGRVLITAVFRRYALFAWLTAAANAIWWLATG